MLNFWYSEACSRQFKLIVIIVTCMATYIASTQIQLDVVLSLVSIGLGILIHVMRRFRLKLKANHPYRNGFQSLSNIIPIVVLITMMGYFPDAKSPLDTFALVIQLLGFMAVGLFLVSIYDKRAKRFEAPRDEA